MPSFSNLSDDEISALIDYVSTGGKPEHAASGKGHQVVNTQAAPVPGYRFTGYEQFNDPDGYPAVAPPWGTLNAINLNTGEYLWQIPLGEYPALAAKGMKDTGTRNYGGPIVTAGGLVFIAATNFDKKMRAFDKDSGKLLWEVVLPFAGNATPATYEVDGRQFVVIAAGAERPWTCRPAASTWPSRCPNNRGSTESFSAGSSERGSEKVQSLWGTGAGPGPPT